MKYIIGLTAIQTLSFICVNYLNYILLKEVRTRMKELPFGISDRQDFLKAIIIIKTCSVSVGSQKHSRILTGFQPLRIQIRYFTDFIHII